MYCWWGCYWYNHLGKHFAPSCGAQEAHTLWPDSTSGYTCRLKNHGTEGDMPSTIVHSTTVQDSKILETIQNHKTREWINCRTFISGLLYSSERELTKVSVSKCKLKTHHVGWKIKLQRITYSIIPIIYNLKIWKKCTAFCLGICTYFVQVAIMGIKSSRFRVIVTSEKEGMWWEKVTQEASTLLVLFLDLCSRYVGLCYITHCGTLQV